MLGTPLTMPIYLNGSLQYVADVRAAHAFRACASRAQGGAAPAQEPPLASRAGADASFLEDGGVSSILAKNARGEW